MTRLTSKELELLRDEGDWKALWIAAVPWVKFAASSLRTDEREDLIQDGLLSVGANIKSWNPALGRFSTFVCSVARNAMLTHIERKDRKAAATRELDVEQPDNQEWSPLPQATYSDTAHTPAGFGDPTVELSRQFASDAAETLLTELNASESLLLRENLGLPILDDPAEAMQIKEIAASRGVPRQTMNRDILELQRFLSARQAQRYTSTHMNIYPPEGREPLPPIISADRRHPGFWSGLASAMGDTDAWRESVGSVWNDWSWKPLDQDIMNGAKP